MSDITERLTNAGVGDVFEDWHTLPSIQQADLNRTSDFWVNFRLLFTTKTDRATKGIDLDGVRLLCAQYAEQAAREPQQSRRKLLAAAAAGSFHSDLSIEDKTSVARAIMQLGPRDISFLRKLNEAPQTEPSSVLLSRDPDAVANLLLAGCLVQRPTLEQLSDMMNRPTRAKMRVLTGVSRRGFTVLQLLTGYSLGEEDKIQAEAYQAEDPRHSA